jgi:hypothetical protein
LESYPSETCRFIKKFFKNIGLATIEKPMQSTGLSQFLGAIFYQILFIDGLFGLFHLISKTPFAALLIRDSEWHENDKPDNPKEETVKNNVSSIT